MWREKKGFFQQIKQEGFFSVVDPDKKYHSRCDENGEALWTLIIIIMHMKTKGSCLRGRASLCGVSW